MKFGRKSEAHPKNAAANGQTVPSGNSLNGTSYRNGHVQNKGDLAIYEQFQNQVLRSGFRDMWTCGFSFFQKLDCFDMF